jgi:hypothetical protein
MSIAHNSSRNDFHQLIRRDDASTSISSLVTTLIPSLLVAVVMVLVFVILRRREQRIYMPRTYVSSLHPSERTPKSPTGVFNWISSMYKLPDTYVLEHHSLEAYLLLRFLKCISKICFVGSCMTFPVLWPVNATGGAGYKQLGMLSISNIRNTYTRYYAHTFVSWVFVVFVFLTITRESIFYLKLRQVRSLSPEYSSRISSRTVLFTLVPEGNLDSNKVRQILGRKKVSRVWVVSDTRELEEKVNQRMDIAMKLEAAEVKLISAANAAHLKALTKQSIINEGWHKGDTARPDSKTGSIAGRVVKAPTRPTHRLKCLLGNKVDTINWARSELGRLTPEVEELQRKHRTGGANLSPAIFVEFYTEADAQATYQSVAHSLDLHMASRYIGVDPSEVIWPNLRIKWWERVVRYIATVAIVTGVVLFWAIPTSVVGAISNINFLTDKIPVLRFIDRMPSWSKGVVTGLLPSVLMAILMALIPLFFRFMAKFGGDPTLSAVELTTQNYYFVFQIVQIFLVVSLTSSATSVVTEIVRDPKRAAELLAENIPQSSNFYISYITLEGLSFSASALLQVTVLVSDKLGRSFLDSTPREMYTRWSTLTGLGWGTVYPTLTLLAVIAITYSCIAPLVLGFATIGLYLFYFAYRYNVFYVSTTDVNTHGKAYIQALQHLTVGCYFLILCLICIFALRTTNDRAALGPLTLEVIFLVFVILYHIFLNRTMRPLINDPTKGLEPEESIFVSQERLLSGNPSEQHFNGVHQSGRSHDRLDKVDGHFQSAKGGSSIPPVVSVAPRKPNILQKYVGLDKYTDCVHLRLPVASSDKAAICSPETERDAYLHPSITSKVPLLWVPRDGAGVSKQEIKETKTVAHMTDKDAWLDDKNRVRWNAEALPPIHEEKIRY